MSQGSSCSHIESDQNEELTGSQHGKVTTAGCVTRFETVDLRYSWVIEDFSAQMDLNSVGDHLTSMPFGNSDHEFVLKLFPAGKDDDCGGYISLFLQIIKCPNPKMQLRIRFSVETQDGPRECSLNKSVLSINRGGIITASKFFHSDIVKNRFLRRGSRDALTVSADITVFLEAKTIPEVPLKDWEDDDIASLSSFDLPVAKPSDCGATNSNSDILREMLTSGRFADFVVVVGDREYKLHRCVLAATSQYFSAMLKDQTLEASEGRVELKDMDADVFDIMVRYTYDVKGPQSDEITMDLIKAVDMVLLEDGKEVVEYRNEVGEFVRDSADSSEVEAAWRGSDFQACPSLIGVICGAGHESDIRFSYFAGVLLMMDGLKAHCCTLLLRDITAENFTLRLQIADFLNNERLFKRLVAFLASNRKDVFAQTDWSELVNTQPKIACKVIEAAWLYADSMLPYMRSKKRRRFCS